MRYEETEEMTNYVSVCTCGEGCVPRTSSKDCPMHGYTHLDCETTVSPGGWVWYDKQDTNEAVY